MARNTQAGTETILAQVVRIFGEVKPHQAYLFSKKRGNRLKVLVHESIDPAFVDLVTINSALLDLKI